MEDRQQQGEQTSLSPFKGISREQFIMTTGTVATSLLVDVATHFDAGSVLFGAAAIVIAARHGKDILGMLVPGHDVASVREAAGRFVHMVSPEPEPARAQIVEQDDQSTTSKLKRLVGMKTPEVAQVKTDRRPVEVRPDAVTEAMPAIERTRMLPENQQATRRLNEEDDLYFDDEDELPAPRSGMFVFSEVLRTFTPTLKKIYIGTLPDGTHLFCEAEDLCHVALAGSTGNGKSSVMRMLVAQLCKAGARVLLLNPHYTRYDVKAQEDWTPFDPYFYRPAMDCRSYEVIAQYLKQVATEILPKRLERYALSQPLGKPYFLVLDEMPAIVHHVKDAGGYLSTILREGRKVGIYLIVASQDFLVKTLFPGGEGGAVRDCFRTAVYVGGDATTAKILLDMPANQVPEDELSKGTVMLRGKMTKKAMLAKVPYVDNQALYSLLGPSTFRQEKNNVVEEDDLAPLSFEAMMAEISQRPERDEQDDEANYEALVKQQERIEKNHHSHVEPVQVVPTPIIADRGPRANDIDLAAAIAVWNAGYNSENKLMKAFPGMTKYQANLLRERIVSQVNVNQEVAE